MRILMHACCAPCAMYPIKYFTDLNAEFDCYYFNPNIHPLDEHMKRGKFLEKVCNDSRIKLHYSCEFLENEWRNFEGSNDERCLMCYTTRLEEVVRFARRNGYDAFTTTLLISPYQDHNLIVSICEKLAEESGLKFVYEDFRKHFREGQNMAKEQEVYRQKYCGCICSKEGNGR